MKTFRIWLLILAAMALAAPLGAEEINAPDARWQTADQTSATNGAQADSSVEAASQNVAEMPAHNAPSVAPVASLAAPIQAVKPPAKPANDQDSHERVMGILPEFTVVNDASTARALSSSEKLKLFYRQTYDPFQFVAAGLSAGMGQAENQLSGYGQGMQGYGKRYGATLADNSLGGFFGNYLLPSVMHEDPRYFRMGSGSFMRRLVHAAGGQVIAHRDDGTVGPAYANVLGNFIGCGFGNLYYPKTDRGVGTTFERGAQVTLTGTIGSLLQEFWPDIHDKMFRKHKIAE